MLKRISGLIGWLGTALIFTAVAILLSRPLWAAYARWMAWAGLVCILVYALGQWREIAAAFGRRQARLGALAVASVLVVLGILVAINYIAGRENKRWDLTAGGQFTLSDQTKKVLSGLGAPLKMIVFDKETNFERFKLRLPEYQYVSRKVSIDYIDPDKKPQPAKDYQVQSYGTIVLDYKGRVERVTSDNESEITNAIIKIVTGEEKKVYFTQGHGERDPANGERSGYNGTQTALQRDNYKVDKLVLLQQKDVPADAAVLVVAGPEADLLPGEIEMLRRYLARGGKLLLLIDPPAKAETPPLTNLVALAKDWGIDVSPTIVVDPVGQIVFGSASYPMAAPPYPPHPIGENFRLQTGFPLARPVVPVSGGVNGRNGQTFVQTSEAAWAESNVQQLMKSGEVALEEDKGDKRGPVSLGVATAAAAAAPPEPATKPDGEQPKAPETRVAVVGDSDFAANYALGIPGNRDFFVNIVNWLAQQEGLISIRAKEPADRRVNIPANRLTHIAWLSIVVIPALIIVAGFYTWWRRR
jgi:ABC-type uncharacterized transport system involved in gliding motility auxiliary subunit